MQESNEYQTIGLLPSPFRISEPVRSSAPPFDMRNAPGMVGDDGSRPLGGDIVGLELGVRITEDGGVGSMGEEEGEPEDSSLAARSGETSSTDGLLLGIGDIQGLWRESNGGSTSSSESRTDSRSSPFRTVFIPCPSDPGPTLSMWPVSSTTTERNADEEEGPRLSATVDH